MGRLKRSCVVGSVVFHTLILAMLVLGPMLLAKREEKVRVIDLVPSEVIDKLLARATSRRISLAADGLTKMPTWVMGTSGR